MSELPNCWAMATLQELAGANGLMDDGDWIESKDQDPEGEVRLIQLADIGDGHFIDKSNRFLTGLKADQLRCTHLRPGDLLIARMPDPLGRSCIFPDIGMPSVTAVDVCIWRASPNTVDARWLMHFVNSPEIRDSIQSQASGTTRQRVSGGNLKRLPIPVPPVQEQRRIVAKLESLRARSSRARKKLDQIPELIEQYKLAILSKAFSGELTADWRHENALPEWKVSTIGEIGEVMLGRQRSPANHTGPQMRPYVRAANITWGGWDLSDVKSMNFDDRDFARFKLQPGDVLVNEGSGSAKEVGKPAIWRGDIDNCCFQNTLIKVRPVRCTSDFLHRYILWCARSEQFVSSTQGVNIFHIGKEGLAQFPIIVPHVDEQLELVRRIDISLAWIDRIANQHARAAHLLPKLDQAILTKAFRGELVPQDPNDEPASALLERIKAERAGADQPRRRRARA